MKRTFILIATSLCAFNLSAQKQWTLQECIDHAMQNNITLQKARLQQQQAAEELLSSKAALLPSLNASTSQSLGYRPWQDDGVTTVTNGQVNTKVDKVYYNGSYALNGDNAYVLEPASASAFVLRGDVDANGKFELADVVMMQKYLLGSGTLTVWQNGDLDSSNTINAKDLTLMKQLFRKG